MSTIGDLPPDGGYGITCPNCGTGHPAAPKVRGPHALDGEAQC